MTTFTSSCHCGAIAIKIDRLPEYINYCNCSLCRASGAKWGYLKRFEVSISGQPSVYVRSDLAKAGLETNFCSKCGSTTHWDLIGAEKTGEGADYRMGVNMANFPPETLSGLEMRHFNGRTWAGHWRDDRILTPDDQF